jgi:hypothetical protein
VLTAAEGRRQKRLLDRQRAISVREAARRKVRELRAAVKSAKGNHGARIKEARGLCKRNKRHVRERARARRRRLLEELRATERLEREAAKQRCSTGKGHARKEARDALDLSRRLLEEERRYQADLRRLELANKAHRRAHALTSSAREKRQESDGEVTANIEAELVPLWNRVRSKIRGSSRQSRTEAFLHYAHEHPREVVAAQESGIEERIAEMEAKANEAHRFSRKRRYTAAELASVPF